MGVGKLWEVRGVIKEVPAIASLLLTSMGIGVDGGMLSNAIERKPAVAASRHVLNRASSACLAASSGPFVIGPLIRTRGVCRLSSGMMRGPGIGSVRGRG